MSEAVAREGVTGELVGFVANLNYDSLPREVRHECLRAFVNALGCTLGGSQHALVHTAHNALAEFAGPPVASLFGRGAKADILTAALLNGLAGAAYSFDDTYSAAMLHPAGPLACALLALAERNPVSGSAFLGAFAGGLEAACRLTKAVAEAPAEAEMAWSQTGIACGIAVALAAGKLLNLDRERLTWAVGIAASEAAGTRTTHGSMAASLIFGHAAQTGLRAAVLASHGFTSAPAAIEDRFGFAALYAKRANPDALVDGLGSAYEFLDITYKPFPCGLVIHPSLDGLLRLRQSAGFAGDDIERIELEVSAAAMKFGWHPAPKDDLEAKVSLHHWIAVAAETGRAGLAEGRPEMVACPRIRALGERIFVTENPELANDAANVRVTLKGGATHDLHVDHCVGSRERPMSDDELQTKFLAQAEPVIGEQRARDLIASCWGLGDVSNVGALAELAAI